MNVTFTSEEDAQDDGQLRKLRIPVLTTIIQKLMMKRRQQ